MLGIREDMNGNLGLLLQAMSAADSQTLLWYLGWETNHSYHVWNKLFNHISNYLYLILN